MIVTGIGSRATPTEIIDKQIEIAEELAKEGWTLRSGGADGSDAAFETGFKRVNGTMEIYLPWKKFNKNTSSLYLVSDDAKTIAERIHPAWNACSHGARLLHGRNVYQVLGLTLNIPSNLVICWTMDGKISGGTRTALMLARENDVPIINMADEEYVHMSAREILDYIPALLAA
jgi:hypothetical protein